MKSIRAFTEEASQLGIEGHPYKVYIPKHKGERSLILLIQLLAFILICLLGFLRSL